MKNDRADVFRLTLEPGQTVTFVAELASDRFARLYLWKAHRVRAEEPGPPALQRHHAGHHRPAGDLPDRRVRRQPQGDLPDGGDLHLVRAGLPVRRLRLLAQAVQRAPRGERAIPRRHRGGMAATLLDLPLHLPAARRLARLRAHAAGRSGCAAQLVLVAVAFLDPRLAATFARLSIILIASVGAGLTLFLALRGQDRALSLVPTWMLLLVWLFGAGVAFTGRLVGRLRRLRPHCRAGADRRADRLHRHAVCLPLRRAALWRAARRAAAALACRRRRGRRVWEWNERRDEIKVEPDRGGDARASRPASCRPRPTTSPSHMHPADRERFKLLLCVREGARRRRDAASSSACATRTTPIAGSSSRRPACRPPTGAILRCVGLLREVTDAKRAQERLMHDAVHDSLTGLPNRELFLDRLAIAAKRAHARAAGPAGAAVHRHRQVQDRELRRSASSSATACC